jgi:hypothetical protein
MGLTLESLAVLHGATPGLEVILADRNQRATRDTAQKGILGTIVRVSSLQPEEAVRLEEILRQSHTEWMLPPHLLSLGSRF